MSTEPFDNIEELDDPAATSTGNHACTLCGDVIPSGYVHRAWTWSEADDPSQVFRAHPGCDRIRREVVDFSEWNDGDAIDEIIDWLDGYSATDIDERIGWMVEAAGDDGNAQAWVERVRAHFEEVEG